jgi:hypothetical protein
LRSLPALSILHFAEPNLAVGGPLTLSKEKAHGLSMPSKCFAHASRFASLAPGESACAALSGDSRQGFRLSSGTVWPWLIGSFVAACARARTSAAMKKKPERDFFPPLYEHLNHAGLGHPSEIYDAEPAHAARLSIPGVVIGELLRSSGAC